MIEKIVKSDEEWRAQLTPDQYIVTRLKGTEPPFSGAYGKTRIPGVYRCVACGAALFDSDAKYDSDSGWPSFSAPAAPDSVTTEKDVSHGMIRTEVKCARCDSHLGHVFPDGPPPGGLRYCINSIALDLKPR
jgi:peptide-methionine (R)-S-oxide reductase